MSFKLGYSDIIVLGGTFAPNSLFPAVEQDPTVAKTYLGTPIQDQLIIPSVGNEEIGLSQDIELNDVVFTVSRPKNIVRTPIQGRDGDVNELINLADYSIEIVGLLNSPEALVAPAELLRDFLLVTNHKGSVAVAVKFLEVFDIDTIIIDDCPVRQFEGVRNQYGFNMRARSEDPIELVITDS